jgi:hypothetical protein
MRLERFAGARGPDFLRKASKNFVACERKLPAQCREGEKGRRTKEYCDRIWTMQ